MLTGRRSGSAKRYPCGWLGGGSSDAAATLLDSTVCGPELDDANGEWRAMGSEYVRNGGTARWRRGERCRTQAAPEFGSSRFSTIGSTTRRYGLQELNRTDHTMVSDHRDVKQIEAGASFDKLILQCFDRVATEIFPASIRSRSILQGGSARRPTFRGGPTLFLQWWRPERVRECQRVCRRGLDSPMSDFGPGARAQISVDE